ncbi:MAG TPA: hypothetical protein PJ986_16110 [Gammaproteobacteria bacterium]|nr:hypothetical protein [Gammaproteobacteria bacterium]
MLALAACGVLLAGVVAITLRIMRQSESAVTLRVRAALSRRLAGLRLGRMLARRGVGAAAYLDHVPADTARRQMSACERCAAVARCDAALEGSSAVADFSFCPNDETVGILSRARAAANDEMPRPRVCEPSV